MKVKFNFNDNRYENENEKIINIYTISLNHHLCYDYIEYDEYIESEYITRYNKTDLNKYIYSTSNNCNFSYIKYSMLNSESEEYKNKIKEEIFIKFSEIWDDNIKEIELEKEKNIKKFNELILNNTNISVFSKNYIRNEKLNKILNES